MSLQPGVTGHRHPARAAPRRRLAIKLAVWLAASLVLDTLLFGTRGFNAARLVSPEWIFGEQNAAPWGVLAFCAGVLWLKRRQFCESLLASRNWDTRNAKVSFVWLGAGVALAAVSAFIPINSDYFVFQVLLGSLGVFVAIFGAAASVPGAMLGLYGLAVSFPIVIEATLGPRYAVTDLAALRFLALITGFPLQMTDNVLTFPGGDGNPITVQVSAACAGPATMGVFLAVFGLMYLESPVGARTAAWLFFAGVVGTWLQNIIRVVIIITSGWLLGPDALWTAHSLTVYISFPAWYLLFAWIYFRQATRQHGRSKAGTPTGYLPPSMGGV